MRVEHQVANPVDQTPAPRSAPEPEETPLQPSRPDLQPDRGQFSSGGGRVENVNFLKTGDMTLHLIGSDKIMFHEGKDRRYKGIGRAPISLVNLNLKKFQKT